MFLASAWRWVSKLPPAENQAILLPGGAATLTTNGPLARLVLRPGSKSGGRLVEVLEEVGAVAAVGADLDDARRQAVVIAGAVFHAVLPLAESGQARRGRLHPGGDLQRAQHGLARLALQRQAQQVAVTAARRCVRSNSTVGHRSPCWTPSPSRSGRCPARRTTAAPRAVELHDRRLAVVVGRHPACRPAGR